MSSLPLPLSAFPSPPSAFPSPPSDLPSPGLTPTRPRLLVPQRPSDLTARALKRLANQPKSLKLDCLLAGGSGVPPKPERENQPVPSVVDWRRDDRVERWRARVVPLEDGSRTLVIGEPTDRSVEELRRLLNTALRELASPSS